MTHTKRMLVIVLLLAAMTLIGACGGAGSTTLADVVEQVAQQGEGAAPGAAQATVSARSLRVRAAPSATAEVVGGIREGEVYDVIGLSSDGEWVQLAVPAIPGGTGWVSTNYVSVQGAITSATITEAVPAAPVAPVSALQLPTPTPRPAPTLAPGPGTVTVQTEGVRLRVRAEPAPDAEIVGYVYEGEVYEVTGTTDDGLWTQIAGRMGTDNPDGGWVASEFLTVN